MSTPVLELQGITKRFGAVQALRDVNLALLPGTVTGLMGDNGAGKSVTMKVLCGALQPDGGRILLRGEPVNFRKPKEAAKTGVAVVYQDLALANNRDVAANVFLGRELTTFGFLRRGAMQMESRRVLDELSIRIPDVRLRVADMSGGQRQCIAIARAVHQGGDVLLLDEPTAALGPEQQENVLRLIEQVRDQGRTVVVVSHNVDHVLRVCDEVVVMQAGRTTRPLDARTTSSSRIVELVMGGHLSDEGPPAHRSVTQDVTL